MADPYITPQAPTSVFGPSQDRRTTLLQMARLDPALTPEQKAQLVTWLQGQAPLTDPALYAWVTRGGQTASIPGAGPVHVPQAAQPTPPTAPQQALQTTAAPIRPTSPDGPGGAPGAGLYQNYIANQKAAASRPIAENPITGPNAGDNVTPAPPATAATTPNATNPTAPNPASSGSTGGSTMATPATTNPAVPGGGDLSTVTGQTLVGANAEPDIQLREALRQAGYDPYSGGLGQQFLARILKPVLQAESSFYGFGQPSADYTQAGNFIKNLVNSFTTKGVNAGAMAQQFAQNITSNPNFATMLAQIPDNQQQGALQNIAALRNYGKSDLEQAAASAQMDRLLGQYRDAAAGLGGNAFNGNFTQFVQNDPRGQALARLLGIGG